jgi:hypothetical protein
MDNTKRKATERAQQSDRVRQLERENKDLREINEILRKAMAWFAHVNACSTGKANGPYVREGRSPD